MLEKKDSYSALTGNKNLKLLFFILFAAVSISIVYIYSYFFWPFLFALVLYTALKSEYDFVKKYLKRGVISSSLIILSIILLVLIPLFLVLVALADQAYEFYLYLQQQFVAGVFIDIIQNSELIKKIFSYADIAEKDILEQLVDVLSKTSLKIFSNLTAVLTFSIKFIINIFFMLLILFFLFKDGEKIFDSLYRILPFPDDIEKDIISRLKEVIKVLLAGNIFIMFLQGFVVGSAFWVFGIEMSLLWATVTAILSLIPVIGTTFVWLPAVIYFSAIGSYISALIIGLWCFLGYLILENIVKPKLFGEKLNFHPLIFFFLLLGSIQAFNLQGIIIGPVLLTLFFSLWEVYKIINESGLNKNFFK